MAEAQTAVGAEKRSKASSVVFTAVKPWLGCAVLQGGVWSRVNHPKRKAEQELPLVLSAELKLGSSTIVVADLTDESPDAVSGGVFCQETEDVEAAVAKAVDAGAVSDSEIAEGEGACSGGSVGKVKDPYGNVWLLCAPEPSKCSDVAA